MVRNASKRYVIKRHSKWSRRSGWPEVLVKGHRKPEAWYTKTHYPYDPIIFPNKKEADSKVQELSNPMFLYRIFNEEEA